MALNSMSQLYVTIVTKFLVLFIESSLIYELNLMGSLITHKIQRFVLSKQSCYTETGPLNLQHVLILMRSFNMLS